MKQGPAQRERSNQKQHHLSSRTSFRISLPKQWNGGERLGMHTRPRPSRFKKNGHPQPRRTKQTHKHTNTRARYTFQVRSLKHARDRFSVCAAATRQKGSCGTILTRSVSAAHCVSMCVRVFDNNKLLCWALRGVERRGRIEGTGTLYPDCSTQSHQHMGTRRTCFWVGGRWSF